MKQIFKKSNIFSFILGAIIFGGIGTVFAYTILAKDVSYTPRDTAWQVDNVKDAIDGLYTKANSLLEISQTESSDSLTTFQLRQIVGAISSGSVVKNITNSAKYKYLIVLGLYKGNKCTSFSTCPGQIDLTFSNATAITVGSTYNQSEQIAGKVYMVFPDGTNDVEITVNKDMHALVVSGLK